MQQLRQSWFGLSVGGATLLAIVGSHYQIDRVRCPDWVPLGSGVLHTAIFLAALLLLTGGWLFGIQSLLHRCDPSPTFIRLWLRMLLPHAVVMLSLPCFSDDSLLYTAIGRAITLHGASGYAPLGQSLPVDDPVRVLIERYPAWLASGSAYGPLWNVLAALIVRLAPSSLTAALHLFQGLGLVSLSAAALLLAGAVRQRPELFWSDSSVPHDPKR